MDLLKVENLTFTYPAALKDMDCLKQKPAVDHVSFTVQEGEFVVICGESGCGKTTLLRLLKRELAPNGRKEGNIWYKDILQEQLSDKVAANEIGFVMQNPDNQLVADKVWHELAFGLENMGVENEEIRRRVGEMACFFGIDTWFRKKTSELSGGQKQLLNLASVMVMQPKLLILDEPSSQLDPIAASDFIHTLAKLNRELGLTIILTEHRLEDVYPIADKVAVMEEGSIVLWEPPKSAAGKLKRIQNNHRMLMGFPSAVRIYNGVHADDECPLTVKEGRDFLSRNFGNNIQKRLKQKSDAGGRNCPEKQKGAVCREIQPDTRKIAMRMKDVWFRYERDLPDVLEDAALTVHEGEIVSILGGNGSGKTTLLSVISGVNRPYKGKIEIFGKRIHKYKEKELYIRNLVLLPQNPQTVFIKMTVRDDYRETGRVAGYEKKELEELIEEKAELLGIGHLLDCHPYDLSGGEQQKAAIGKILLLEPRLILLDEPTKGIDAWAKHQFGKILIDLREQGIAVLMVTHDVEFAAEVSDRCGMFFDRRIISMGTPENFFCGNNFYTTAANRISRHLYENAVTCEDVIALCRRNKKGRYSS